jgi:hypothetical protein
MTPEEQVKQNALIQELAELYEKIDKLSAQQARNLAQAQANAGNLKNEITRLSKNLDDLVFNSDFLYRSFQETTAELRNQNVLLKLGKSAFSDLTKQADKLSNFQKGYSDLQEKDFKKIKESFEIQNKELSKITDDLEKNEDTRKEEIKRLNSIEESGKRLTKTEKERLNTLIKEQGLLEASQDALNNGIKLLEKEYNLTKQIYKSRQDLGGLTKASASIIQKYGGDLAQYLDLSEAIEAVDEYNKKVIDNALSQKNVIAALQDIEKQKVAIQQEVLNAAREVREIELQINLAKTAQAELDQLSIQSTQKRNELTTIGLESERLINDYRRISNDLTLDATTQAILLRDINQEIRDLSNQENNILQEQESLTNKIIDAQSRILDINELENEAQQKKVNLLNLEANVNEKLAAEETKAYNIKEAAIKATSTGLTGFINKFKSLNVLVNNLNFTKVLTDPITLMTTLVNIGFKANAQVVELGKSFGISADAAENLRQDYADFARSTGDTFINTDRLLKAQTELSQQLGIAVRFSNEELATFAKLTELTGLSAQEAGKLAQASAAAGVPTEKYTDSIREAAFYAQQATGTHFSSKEILQDVSKLSAGILVKFQGNPKAIGQAVVEAKKLGLTLEQIDKVGESLLNFEQSLENELKAELITGKQLNLERARAAALSGDQLALTREISSQVGTLNDFQNMNVIAQKSLADAFGLSRDEMSEMLMKQEAINKYGDEAAKLNKEQLEDMKRQGLSASEYLKKQEQQRAAQDKFQDAMIKLQDIIGNLVAGPVGQLLDALADIVGVAVNILSIFSPLFKVISFIAEKISDFASTDFGKVVLSMGAITLFLPKIATGLGLATKGVMGLGTGIASVFKADTWKSWGKGLQSVFNKDKFTGFFSSLKDKFLEAAGLNKKLEEGLTDTITGAAADKTKEVAAGATEKIVEEGKESLTDKLKDKATETIEGKATETIEGKVEDKAGDLVDKVTGKADEVTEKTKGGGVGGFLKGIKMNDVLKGAAAILVLSGALFVAAKAFQEFADVNWEDMAKAGVALAGLATVAGIIGAPPIIGFIEAGAFALASLGVSLIPFALAARIAAPAIETFGKAIKSTFEGIGTIITAAANGIATIFGSLEKVDATKLEAIGPALIKIGLGLASLGGGGVLGAIGAFLSGDPIEKLQSLAAAGDGLTKTATALKSIALSLAGISLALSTIDTSKLGALDEFASNRSTESIVGGITDFITAPIKAIGESIGGKEEINTGIDLTPMIAAINEVKASINNLQNRPIKLYIDSKEIMNKAVQNSSKIS